MAPRPPSDPAPRPRDDGLLRVGIIGTLVTALCCFTPILALLLGAIGLTALLAGLDYVLLPALAGFLALTAWAAWRRRRRTP